MRRCRRLLSDDFYDMAYRAGVFTASEERLSIDRQANLMRVHQREKEEAFQRHQQMQQKNLTGVGNASSSAVGGALTPPPLMSSVEINERMAAFEDAHAKAASRMDLSSKAFGTTSGEGAFAVPDLHCHVIPPQWGDVHVPGWQVAVDTSVPMPSSPPSASANNNSTTTTTTASSSMEATTEAPYMVVSKTFVFLDQPRTYKFFAYVAGAIEELGLNKYADAGVTTSTDGGETVATAPSASSSSAMSPAADTALPEEDANGPIITHENCLRVHPLATPKIEWMWSEITVTMIASERSFMLANYLNDLELKLGTLRNRSADGLKPSGHEWSEHLEEKVARRAHNNFMWMFNDDRHTITEFIQSTYIQWSNRAEYLISRKSRERREFRPDMTLSTVIQQGAERKRRVERRKFKDKIADASAKSLGMEREDYDRYSVDMLPREMREQLDEDRSKVGGMREFEHRAGGLLGYSRPSQIN